jgi:hypothetical protein
VSPVETTDDYAIYSSPILLNGYKTNLRYAFIFDETLPNNGYYVLLGAWSGIDPATGMSDKEIIEIAPTDEILAFSTHVELDLSALTDSGVLRENKPVPQRADGYTIAEEPVSDDYAIIYAFVITDIFGNTYYSKAAWFEIDYSQAQLAAQPLADGQSAGTIVVLG